MTMKNAYKVTITAGSEIAITRREAEQVREYFEDIGFENICITETGKDSNGFIKTDRLVEPSPVRVNLNRTPTFCPKCKIYAPANQPCNNRE